MNKLFIFHILLFLLVSCRENVKSNDKFYIEEKEALTNSSVSTNDFVSSIDLSKVYNNELSTDFVVLGVYGNQLYEHYQMCKTKGLSIYSYDTIWESITFNENKANQEKPRVAFLTKENFHLMQTEQWDPKKDDFVIDSYKPTDSHYKYHLGNGFAFDETNEISDFNLDGFLDIKVKYTKLDYENAGGQIRAIRSEMFAEYKEKVKEGELSKTVKFEDFVKEQWELNDDFGLFGDDGYITRYSNNGLIHFFTLD